MSTAKTAKIHTVEELKEKAKLALNVPRLVEIVKNAPVAEDGKINLTQLRDEAYQYTVEQTGDLKDAKKLADSTRALAMLRRDFPKEFEKLVAQERQPDTETQTQTRKLFEDMEFEFFDNTATGMELITRKKRGLDGRILEGYFLRFDSIIGHIAARKFCMKILEAIIEASDHGEDFNVMNDSIQLLEEKFGLKIRVCGICLYYCRGHGICGYPKTPDAIRTELDGFRAPWLDICMTDMNKEMVIGHKPKVSPEDACIINKWTSKEEPSVGEKRKLKTFKRSPN